MLKPAVFTTVVGQLDSPSATNWKRQVARVLLVLQPLHPASRCRREVRHRQLAGERARVSTTTGKVCPVPSLQ